MALLNFLLMCGIALLVFQVPIKGSFWGLLLASTVYAFIATGMGVLASALTRSQIAALFLAMISTLVPAVQFAGLLHPVSSLEGLGRIVGEIYPATHMLIINRGIFGKALNLSELMSAFIPLLAAVPVVMGAAILLLKKQER